MKFIVYMIWYKILITYLKLFVLVTEIIVLSEDQAQHGILDGMYFAFTSNY